MPYNSRADVVCLLAERYDTKSNIRLGGFQFQLQASYMSSHTEELWYNETVCGWLSIYIYIYIYTHTHTHTGPLVSWVESSLIGQETWVQSQVKSYQRLKKWYMMTPCLTLSIMLGVKGTVEQSREKSSILSYT